MSAENLLARLDRVRKTSPGEWVARCPAHDDRGPSLSIKEAADGRVLIHDFGGCSASDVLAALGLTFSDLFPAGDPDDAGRRSGWRSAGYRDSRQDRMTISARTALVAIAHDAIEAAVVVSDVANGRAEVGAVRPHLFELAGRIGAALDLSGVSHGR